MDKRTVLYADEGKVLTNGSTYGKVIFLSCDADSSDYTEIAEEEYERKLKSLEIQ